MFYSRSSHYVATVKHPVGILYCISSTHGHCEYAWRKIGDIEEKQFPSSPVIYIKDGGLYQCMVKTGDDKISGRIYRVYKTTIGLKI